MGQVQADLNLQARLEALAVEVVGSRLGIDRFKSIPPDRAGAVTQGSGRAGATAVRDPAQIDGDYAAVLRDDGAPLDATDPEEMAAWVRASAVREQLIQALDNWAFLKRDTKLEGAERLGEAAQRADGNDWRRRLRDLSARGDRAALEQLAGQNDVLEQPPPALAELGRSLSQVGATAVAVEMLRKAQQRYPGDLGINILLGVVLDPSPVSDLPQDRILCDREEAIGFLRAGLAIRPRNPLLHGRLGSVLAEQSKRDEAAAEFRRAIDLDPKCANAHYCLGLVFQKQVKRDEAVAEYRRAIDLDPKFTDAHMNLGTVLDDQGKLEEAAAEYRRAVDVDPKDAFPHVNLGNVLDDQGKPDEAAAEYRRAIDLDPNYADAYYNLGIILEKQGKLEEAAAAYQRRIDLDTKNALAYCNLCVVLRHQGKFAQSLSSWRRVIELPPPPDAPFPNWHIESVYNAACAASLAAAGKGVDAGLDDKERARLRSQALDWLRTDLTAWDKRRQDDPKAGPEIQTTLQSWKTDADLAGVRDADALAKLPDPERAAWRKLWADVDALLTQVGGAKTP